MRVFTEFDMQAAAYHHLRKMFHRDRGDKWIVRNQPVLYGRRGKRWKPDIAVFKNTILMDVIEFKCNFTRAEESSWDRDEQKIRTMKRAFDLRHAYQIVMYDDDCNYVLESRDKAEWCGPHNQDQKRDYLRSSVLRLAM